MKRVSSRVSAVLCVGAAVLLLVGCGGGGSSSSASASGGSAPMTHAEYASAADDICRADHEANATFESKFEAVFEAGLTTPARRERAAGLVRAAAPAVERELKQISRLTPPGADETAAHRVVKEFEVSLQLNEAFADALEHGSVAELETVSNEVVQNGTALRGLAKDLGLKVCGRPDQGE